MEDYNHFVVIAAGDNPETFMPKYDKTKKVEPYVVYKFKDAKKIKERFLNVMEELLNTNNLNGVEREEIIETIKETKEQSDEDFYFEYTEDYEYDDKTGDAISDKNPDGKWSSYRVGKLFSVPFMLKDGHEVFCARKGEIDWPKMHLHGQEIYSVTWDLVMGGKKPENDKEERIYNNMKNRTGYFEKFGNKEKYVASCTAFWGYAYVDKNGWKELGEGEDQFEWMISFYDKFIKPLPDDTLLTIYECVR